VSHTGAVPVDERATSGEDAAIEFRRELAALLKRLPPAPVLPVSAFDRNQIYNG
jgi:hypothetical protein